MPVITLNIPQALYDSLKSIAQSRGFGNYMEYLISIAREDLKAERAVQARQNAEKSALQNAESEWSAGPISVQIT